ncbi:MAG: recombination protein RecR [Spirochaetales bacterium]|nr:recombination protein RecR [Spirochaetales bacterium]
MALNILNKLEKDLLKFPGIGQRLARKLAIYLLTRDKEENIKFIEDLKEIDIKVFRCEECFALVESGKLCDFCRNPNREKRILVVHNVEDYLLLSENKIFDGYYHILNGLISPIRGITPDMLSIEKLIDRIEKRKIIEIIFALPGTNDGLITTLYIKNQLKERFTELIFSKIAEGIPYGSGLSEISMQTILTSLKNRENIQ